MTSARVSRYSRLTATSIGAGLFAAGIGFAVLVGWWAHIDSLKRVFPGFISMNPVTAMGFMLAGFSLYGQVRGGGWVMRCAKTAAWLVLVVGSLRLASYAGGWDLPLDRWFFADRLYLNEPGEQSRMAPNTSMAFVALGLALVLLDLKTKRELPYAELFAMAQGLVAMLALVGYIHKAQWLYGVPTHVPMALHTAVAFLVLAIGVFFARPERGMMAVVTGDGPVGILARRMIPAAVLVFVFAGALARMGEHRGFIEAGQSVAVYTVLSIGVFGGVVLGCARSLHRSELERRRLTEESESFFALSLDLLCIAGTDGYFTRVNPAFSRLLGFSAEEMVSRPFLDFVHPEDTAATLREMEKLNAGQPTLHFENRYRCKDGSWKWLAWSARPFVEEGTLYAVARDVTAEKEVRVAIVTLNAELLQQTARLEAVNQELESFSYSVSHDLRAPLRAISGFAEALEEHAAASLDATGLDYLKRIRNAGTRMGDLIDDLLQLSRLTRAEMTLRSVDLSVVANEIVADFRQADPGREVKVVIAPSIRVFGDPSLLRILLENLLGNAWKFTSKNPAARIEMGGFLGEDGRMSCYIRDNGVGFDNRYAHKLFGAFQRLHSQVEFPGTGIGLATVQRIVHRHGGEVRADGMIDDGATFEFTLDADPEMRNA